MYSRSPNYYFETIFHRIEREIALHNPALILVTPADWKVLLASIPKTQRTIIAHPDRPLEMVWKDDDLVERTFRRVPSEEAPSGTLDLTGGPSEDL